MGVVEWRQERVLIVYHKINLKTCSWQHSATPIIRQLCEAGAPDTARLLDAKKIILDVHNKLDISA